MADQIHRGRKRQSQRAGNFDGRPDQLHTIGTCAPMGKPIILMGSQAYPIFPTFTFGLVTNLLIDQNDLAVVLIISYQQILSPCQITDSLRQPQIRMIYRLEVCVIWTASSNISAVKRHSCIFEILDGNHLVSVDSDLGWNCL